MTLPADFINQMKNLLGSEYSDFEASLHEQPSVSIRINPSKTENEFNLSQKVPWCADGYYLESRPVFTIDPFFHAGHYYVQEASSMFIDTILKKLKLKKNPRILDLCSAPGGKSTLLLAHLANQGFVHCHEFDPFRMGILKQNIERWGYPNVIITYGSLHQLERLDYQYDLILIDAPCSGEGMFRKEADALKQWNTKKINHCCNLQNNIMNVADSLCAENGYIIYSTCTWNRNENEQILESYIQDNKYQSVKIEQAFNITETQNPTYTYRFFPHKISGEGYTVSVLRKEGSATINTDNANKPSNLKPIGECHAENWLNDHHNYATTTFKDKWYAIHQDYYFIFQNIVQSISTSYLGIPLGNQKGKEFYPAHGLSQSICLHSEIHKFQMNSAQALDYLRAMTPSYPIQSETRWLIAAYKSAKLGWLKSSGSGIKNYFPIHQRILSF